MSPKNVSLILIRYKLCFVCTQMPWLSLWAWSWYSSKAKSQRWHEYLLFDESGKRIVENISTGVHYWRDKVLANVDGRIWNNICLIFFSLYSLQGQGSGQKTGPVNWMNKGHIMSKLCVLTLQCAAMHLGVRITLCILSISQATTHNKRQLFVFPIQYLEEKAR